MDTKWGGKLENQGAKDESVEDRNLKIKKQSSHN